MGGKNLVFVFALAACGGGNSNPGGVGSGGQQVGNHLGAACGSDNYVSQIDAVCKTLHPPPPAAGDVGALCSSNNDCNSGRCQFAYLASTGNCAASCSASAPCPDGLACSAGWCVQPTDCSYAGSDTTSCVTTLNQQANLACGTSCDQKFAAWLACIAKAGRLCFVTDAHTACGIERGQLESCCSACASSDL
jgi:hypothetical protein